jgi:hypothetical protein
VTIGVPLAAIAKFINGHVMPDAGDNILQYAAIRLVKEHIVGDNRRNASLRSHIGEFEQSELIVWSPPQCQRHIGAVAKALPHAPKPQSAKVISDVRNEDGDQPVAIKSNVIPFDLALAFTASLLAE